MKPYHKKIMFLEMILLYVIMIFAVKENMVSTQDVISADQILRDKGDGDIMDPYKDLPKKIALTFDDGPNADYTEMLLKGLKERDVTVSFLLGKEVVKHPEIVKDIFDDGHLIGTHSYEHVNLCELGDRAAAEQINKTNDAIYEIIGEYPQYIRPPFGCLKCDLDEKTGMIQILWDVDPLDWKTGSAGVITKRVLNKVQENDIILMHDASESSVKAAFRIIDELKKQGYEFVTVEDILME